MPRTRTPHSEYRADCSKGEAFSAVALFFVIHILQAAKTGGGRVSRC